MDDGRYVATRAPDGSRPRVAAVDAGGDERPLAVPGMAWGWETEATRRLAAALLEDATGHAPLPEMAWDLCAEVLGRAERCPPSGWVLTVAEVLAWRRSWLRRAGSRARLERALAGALLAAPAALEGFAPDELADPRLRLVCARAVAAAAAGRAVDLVDVQLAVEALGLGDDPGFVRALLDAAPVGPGPHWWHAQLRAALPRHEAAAARLAALAAQVRGARAA